MLKFRVMLVALAATVFAVGQVGVARAFTCVDSAPGGGSPAIISGTYTINFLGSEYDDSGDAPLAGSGSVTVDGKGDVTGGVIRCNQFDSEWTSPITGGCYTVNTDGTAFMTITTNSEDNGVCDFADGVDLQLAISFAGNQFQFSSDGSFGSDESVAAMMIEPLDVGNFDTGAEDPFAGTANRLTPNLGWP
jgi:hypothetical protein